MKDQWDQAYEEWLDTIVTAELTINQLCRQAFLAGAQAGVAEAQKIIVDETP